MIDFLMALAITLSVSIPTAVILDDNMNKTILFLGRYHDVPHGAFSTSSRSLGFSIP